MDKNKALVTRIVSIFLIAFGFAFGGTWKSRFCLGDSILSVLGFPTWSKGASGTHYATVIGIILILIGIGAFNYTLKEKARRWVGISVIISIVVLSFVSAYI